MMQINTKRCLSLILALALTFSLLPVSALAEEEVETVAVETTSPTEVPAETTAPVTEETVPETTTPAVVAEETAPVLAAADSGVLDSIQARMNEILIHYLGTTELTEEEAANKVADMDEDTWFQALMDVEDLENSEELQSLTEEEQQTLVENNTVFCAFADAVYQRTAADGTLYTTVTVLDGQVSVTDSANSNTVSGGTVTIQAKGNLLGKKTNNITITNETDSKAQLSFEYTTTYANSFKIADATAAASGNYSVTLDSGVSLSITLVSNSGWSNTTATLKLSNFSLVAVADSSKITFEFDSKFGGVTVDGTAITSGDELTIPGSGAALAATPASGAVFHGWIDSDGKILSKEASYTLEPTSNMTVKAVFTGAGSAPLWGVGAASEQTGKLGFLDMSSFTYHTISPSYLFDDLNAANDAAAASQTAKAIVLMNSGTLAKGDYEISSGVSLLIPYESTYKMYSSIPELVIDDAAHKVPTAFRTLTLESGANIKLYGTMSLSAKVDAYMGSRYQNAAPSGSCGFISTAEGSSISVESGATLYTWGYIIGNGQVEVKSGGTVYECFQVRDWRGGAATSGMVDNEQRVFPISQYYVQNIEATLKLYSGATEKGVLTLYLSRTKYVTAFTFIGNDGMFRCTGDDSYVTKRYDGSNDRLILEASGSVSLSSIKITEPSELDSASYTLGINGNITVNLLEGCKATVSQDLALLPGAIINIAKGATVTLGEGVKMYIYDHDQWGPYVMQQDQMRAVLWSSVNGSKVIRTAANLTDAAVCVNGTVDASAGYIYTTSSGANIYSTDSGVIKTTVGTDTATYQATYIAEEEKIDYTAIPITSAQLKHGNGKYLATGDEGQGSGTYYYNAEHAKWVKDGHTFDEGVVTDPTCTAQGYTTYTCTCGHSYKDTYVDALGHSYTWEIKAGYEATLTAPATETGTCSACGGTDTRNPNSAAIGDDEFLTLQNALDTAGELATITLKTNITGDISISKPVVIAFGGYTATITAGAGYRIPESENTDESVTIRRNPRVVSTNIALNEGLDLYFYVKASDIGPDTGNYVAVVSKDFADDREDNPVVETYSSGGWKAYPSNENLQYYRFGFADISAKEMTDLVTVTIQDTSGNTVISDKDGTASESVYTQTIQNYAVTMLNHYEGATDQKTAYLRTALMDMLEYGAEAQVKFNYNTDNPANVESSGTLAKYSPSTENPKSNVTKNWSKVAGVTISAKNKLLYTFYFNITNPDGFYAMVTYTHRNGESVNERIEAKDFYKRSEGLYGVDVPYLNIADGFVALNCELYDNTGSKIAYGTDSIAGYAERNQGTSGVYMAMMRFVNSAITYFDYE